MEGWISLHRKILDNPIVCKDSDYFSVWCYLLLNATHTGYDVTFRRERITLKPGQLITGRKKIAAQFNISESKVQRILKKLEIEQQIEQQTGNRNRLVTVLNWHQYQKSEHNQRTSSEQQVNTNNNVKKDNKKDIKKEVIEIVDYLNDKANKNFKPTTGNTVKFINGRLKDGYTVDDFKKVIDIKVSEWGQTDYKKYLTPKTLFNPTNFENYVNEHPNQVGMFNKVQVKKEIR